MNWNFKQGSGGDGWWEAYYSPMGEEVFDVYNWCRQQFGPAGCLHRWTNDGGWVRFRDKDDMLLFLLRWS
jgi:hypothetical protein